VGRDQLSRPTRHAEGQHRDAPNTAATRTEDPPRRSGFVGRQPGRHVTAYETKHHPVRRDACGHGCTVVTTIVRREVTTPTGRAFVIEVDGREAVRILIDAIDPAIAFRVAVVAEAVIREYTGD
jgi:hypothetical protein